MGGGTHVLSFNFDTEDFLNVELPDATGNLVFKCLFILGESVAAFGISCSNCCIWVMNKDGTGGEKLWSLRFTGDSCYDAYSFFRSYSFDKSFYDEHSGKLFTMTTLAFGDVQMVSYDVKSHKVHRWGKSIRPYLDFGLRGYLCRELGVV
ncbi:hypothetical protein SOVF_035750 [Spinacia oleracea]|nr:hypothetical protein SOVF_035750 [Spinacia oleracea]